MSSSEEARGRLERLHGIARLLGHADRVALFALVDEFAAAHAKRAKAWAPIATAPKDRRVLLFYPGLHESKGVAVSGQWRKVGRGFWRHDVQGGDNAFEFTCERLAQPTLWAELPGAPE